MSELAAWIEGALGRPPLDPANYARALTHRSRSDASGEPSYERLEFLGDRVLGLIMAEWLYEVYPDEVEGELTKRFNTLVTGAACAEIAGEIGVAEHLRLGKQGRSDGVHLRETVLGDTVEALLGALYREHGLDAARAAVRRLWGERVHATARAPQHPKSALQEWASAHGRAQPNYEVIDRRGPDHAPRLTIRVAVGRDEAVAEGRNKQEAEITAARALLARLAG